ncbi:hypothetical protein, partial [Cardiobacterium valvarum]
RLSGRQTKKGRKITAPALLEGMLKLLSAQELLEFYDTGRDKRDRMGCSGWKWVDTYGLRANLIAGLVNAMR